MEEFEFWVHVSRLIGIKLDFFQEIKERSLHNYRVIQENLNKTQNSFKNSDLPTNAEIYYVEQNLHGLSKAISFQENFILLKGVELFFYGLSETVETITGKTKIKKIIRVCNQVQKRIQRQTHRVFNDIFEIALQEIKNFKWVLKSKLSL